MSEVITVRQIVERYLASGSTTHREAQRHGRWWIDQLGDLPAQKLTAELIRRNLQTLAKRGRSGSTGNFYLRFIRRVCKWGLAQHLLPADPSEALSFQKEVAPDLRVLTESEEDALCAALGPPYGLWVRFAIATGLKQAEQFSLRWRDVDVKAGTVLIPDPSAGAVASLSLSPAAIDLLHELRTAHPASLWVFPDLRNPTRPANVHAFYTGRWHTAVQVAGIPWCAWKDLRTTCGVRLAKQGLSVDEITLLMRQRERRQAYYYRAWQPGQKYLNKPPRRRAELVFASLSPEELLQLIGRDIVRAPLSFREVCHLYAAHHLKGRPSQQQFQRMYRQFWRPWCDRLPAEITRKEIRLWYLGLESRPAAANKAATFLRGLYNWAIRMELLTCPNPVTGLIRFRQYARERFLTAEEVRRFMVGLPYLPIKPRAFLSVLLMTGSRRGEALGMRWSEIDLEHRLWRKSRTKNGTSQLVQIPVQVADALSLLPRESEWVFPGANGRHWSTTSADKTWAAIRARWNMNDVTLHDLRRSCASYMAISGENLPTIQNVLNHRSLHQTSVYARLNIGAVGRALQDQADRFSQLASVPSLAEASTAMSIEGG
ncbi:tyrosine-type recombinase/integrase [Nitrospira moscoviensis]|uniref:Phage integrase n=1 Tax=Nitrospira moscoviensis TaxID=42253 RepID=A0A0K2GHS8_NITMO|nr:tyrosine-type recombinase/integrase [Nitrospira moscoviensis]ALA60187.1 hypothetical protein NITMOv2_3797 [Nitrospira moscoviensis]